MLRRLAQFIQPFAEHLGAPGLALVAFVDSSFLSLPEVLDTLVVASVIQHPARWFYYGLMTTAGSVLGCYVLYELARRGGEAFLRKRMHERHVDRGLEIFRRYGVITIIVPAILPPPVPFKPFLLLAGVAEVRPLTFVLAVAAGRGFRYVGEAWLAYRYGGQALEFMRANLPIVSLWAAVAIVVVGAATVVWRRRRTA